MGVVVGLKGQGEPSRAVALSSSSLYFLAPATVRATKRMLKVDFEPAAAEQPGGRGQSPREAIFDEFEPFSVIF